MVDFYGKLVGKYTSPLDQAKRVAQSCLKQKVYATWMLRLVDGRYPTRQLKYICTYIYIYNLIFFKPINTGILFGISTG